MAVSSRECPFFTLANCTLIARDLGASAKCSVRQTARPSLRYQRVVGPHPSLVAGEDPGVHEDLEVVRDGRLGKAEGFGQVADAGLAAFARGNHRDEAQPCGVGQRLQYMARSAA